jgi:hypothetical protein
MKSTPVTTRTAVRAAAAQPRTREVSAFSTTSRTTATPSRPDAFVGLWIRGPGPIHARGPKSAEPPGLARTDSGLSRSATAASGRASSREDRAEGEWDEVMALLKTCVETVAASAPRVSVVVKIDHRPGITDGLHAKVAAVEARLDG